MDERNLEGIMKYLQNAEVQEHIRQTIARGRAEATVRIGWAAHLFDFTDSQLRDWEHRGLLNPIRSKDTITGQRQYSLDELDKLAIIRELIDAKFSPSEIPPNIDEIWRRVYSSNGNLNAQRRISGKHMAIDQRIEWAEQQLFWRYCAYSILRLSLMLIRESVSDTIIALVLPLEKKTNTSIPAPEGLPTLGKCLIGWLIQNESFYMFLDSAPSFEQPSDFRIHPLQAMKDDMLLEDAPKDNTLIVVQRKAKPLALSIPVVETIRRLLTSLYDNVHQWESYFRQGMQNVIFPATNFNTSENPSDDSLNSLADLIVCLGNGVDGRRRWRFCCILLPNVPPNNSMLPMQQQRLIVRAQSKDAPHTVGVTRISPNKSVIGLSLRAFLSGKIIYRSTISDEDTAIVLREIEGEIGSAIAVPVDGEDGLPLAVIYVASYKDEIDAFSENDQRVLRMVGRMIEELLMTYHTRQQVTANLEKVMKKPTVVDEILGDFLSENDFIRDIEALLIGVQKDMPEKGTEVGDREVSFISLDIDNQSGLASMYGNRVTRNLSRVLGDRIYSQLRLLFTKSTEWRFYYIYGGRFYILLDGTSLDSACEKARQLQEALNGDYKVDALRIAIDQPTLPDDMLKLSGLTIRLGVTGYEYWKLAELLERYADRTPVASVRSLITRFLDIALDEGKQKGPNSIITWNREKGWLTPWPWQE